ncbi:ribosome biogenesis GTP-binding protein YihA/YsxC [Abyssibacter sp.]|jgi:GTP-binding protein|uniref:ribosome biogenesis GTP-binding protein YihA/YsxC n=1 Tax=Abyssibacter sp. TaxID=2320200 RepID=UPI003510FE0D
MIDDRTESASRLLARAQFECSAAALRQAPEPDRPEIAFAGRSNAGKSSVINAVTRQKSLARTSKTPGRTQLLNFFQLEDTARLVDLPGYGFAKAPESVRREWHRMIEAYLQYRDALVGLVIIMDSRRPLTETDVQMLNWCAARPLPCIILLNKADKLSKGAAASARQGVIRAIDGAATVLSVSARTGTGIDAAKLAVVDLLLPQTV